MSQILALAVLFIGLCAQFSAAQTLNSPNYAQASTANSVSDSLAAVNKERRFQFPNAASTFQSSPMVAPVLTSQSPSSLRLPPSTTDSSPLQNFIASFKTAVSSSEILSQIFDLTDLTPEAYNKSLYDYVFAIAFEMGLNNAQYLASAVSMPLKEGIESFSLPLTTNIYASAAGEFLSAKGVLCPANALTLAKKFAKTMEDSAKRRWVKEIPASKFLVLEDGFSDYMTSLDQYTANTLDELVHYYARAVKLSAARL